MTRAGSQMTAISEPTIRSPSREKRPSILIGVTWIGRHGRKKRSSEKGQRKATPRPPSVMASNKPWEIALSATRKKTVCGAAFKRAAKGIATRPRRIPKAMEWVKPL